MAERGKEELLAHILLRADEVKERDTERNRHWDDLERIRYREHDVAVPPRFQQQWNLQPVKTSLVNRDIRTVVSILTESFPRVVRPPRDESQKAQDNSSLVEKSLNSILAQLDGAGGSQRPYRRATDNAAGFGLGVHKLLYLPDAIDADEFQRRIVDDVEEHDEEYTAEMDGESRTEKRSIRRPTQRLETDVEYNRRVDQYREEAPLPFVWLAIDPRTFHAVYRNGQLVEVLEIGKRRRYDLADTWEHEGVSFDKQKGRLVSKWSGPEAETALGGTPGETIDYCEHWKLVRRDSPDDPGVRGRRSSAVVTYVADQTILAKIDTGYNRLPYFPFHGISTASSSPRYESQSVVEDVVGYVPAIDTMLTMRQNWGFMAAYAMGYYRRMTVGRADAKAGVVGGVVEAEAAGSGADVLEFEPATFKHFGEGDEVGWVQPPPVGRDLTEMPEMMLALAREASPVPDILRGKTEPDTPAYLGAQNLAAAQRAIDPITSNQAVALTEMGKFILWLVENKHQDPVYVDVAEDVQGGGSRYRKLRLRPEDIGGYYALSVEISTLSQDRMIQLGQFLAQMQSQGAVSMKRLRQDGLQIQAPEEEDDDVLFERYTQSPEFQQEVFDGFRRMIARMQAEQPQPGQEQGQPMDPAQAAAMQQQGGIPPEQAGAMPGQPGMAPEQMQGGMPPGQFQAPLDQASAVQPITGAPPINVPTPGLGLPLVSPVLGPGSGGM